MASRPMARHAARADDVPVAACQAGSALALAAAFPPMARLATFATTLGAGNGSEGGLLVSEIPADDPAKFPVEQALRDVLGRLGAVWSARILLSRGGTRWLFLLVREPDGLTRTLSFELPDHDPEIVRMALMAALPDARERRRLPSAARRPDGPERRRSRLGGAELPQ